MDPIQQYVLGLIVLGLPAVSGSVFLLAKAWGNLVRSRELKVAGRLDAARLESQDRKIGQLEGELAAMREEMDHIQAVEGFYKQLRSPAPATEQPGT